MLVVGLQLLLLAYRFSHNVLGTTSVMVVLCRLLDREHCQAASSPPTGPEVLGTSCVGFGA